LVPLLPREQRRQILMAGGAHVAIGIHHLRRAAGAIVLDDLELEAPRELVVADHLQKVGLFLIAQVEPILQQEAGGAFAVYRNDDPRKREKIRRRRDPLQRASEW